VPCTSGLTLADIGGVRTTQLFTGNLVTSGATISRGVGADFGSFRDDGFAVGQQIRVTIGGVTVDRRISEISVDGLSMTLDSAPGTGDAAGALSLLSDRGIYTGALTYVATDATDTSAHVGGGLVRTDGKSWLDSGFFEGQLIRIEGLSGTYKIEFITDAVPGSGKLDLARLTTVLPGNGTIGAGSAANVMQVARTVTFTASNWYSQVTVPLLADPLFDLQPGRGDLKTFPKKAHLLSGIRGPLAVEGGVTTADRSLKHAVLLPGEANTEPFQVAAQPPEWQMIDTLNVFADGSQENLVGQMTSAAITGLNMTADLDLRAFCGIRPCPFGEPGKYPGGVTYGTYTVDAGGNFITEGGVSTIEVLNLFLGQGNDKFTVLGTLIPAVELANNGTARAASHGGITTVHGGGNTALAVTGSFTTTPTSITRDDGVDWMTQGFKVGQTITTTGAMAGTYTITGFAGTALAPNSTILVATAVGVLGTLSAAASTISVRDELAVTGAFDLVGNKVLRRDGQPWQSLGFAAGQHVTIAVGGGAVRTIIGFDNSGYGDGTALIVDGPPLSGTDLAGTVATYDRPTTTAVRMGGDTLIVTGGASTTAAGGPASPLVIYGDTSQDGTWYGGRTDVLSLGIFGNKPFAHDENVPVTITTSDGGLSAFITRTDLASWVAKGFAVGAQLTVNGVLYGTVSRTSASVCASVATGCTTIPSNVMKLTALTSGFVAVPVTTPKNIAVQNRVGNGAPFFVFPLATAYANAGNDVIDAHLAFSASPAGALPTVGITAYGGAGDDTIIGTQTGDHLAGGSGTDRILGQRGTDLIYGDSGYNVNVITRELFVVNNNISSKPNADLLAAAADVIHGDGYGSSPSTFLDDFADVVIGDKGEIFQNVLGARDTTQMQTGLQRIQTTAIATLRDVESRNLQSGGDDWLYGTAGRDVMVGGPGHDAIDGGTLDDLVFGDNVVLTWRDNDVTSLRFQTLSGLRIYSRTDFDNTAALGYDNSGQLLVDGVARDYRSPDANVPWWAEYAVTNLHQNTSMDSGLTGVGSFGNDYIAGGAANDLLFGQLGSDTIQGDGSIDFISHKYVDDVLATIDPALLGGRARAYRTPGGCVGTTCDPTGPLTVYPSYEAAGDGDDYIEGGAGNDTVFGGLGQDDIVGGSSSFFSLMTPDQRPDGSDLLFGGAGTRIARDVDSFVGAADQHARDADVIVGDNGNIVRIVGTNHVDVGPLVKYVTFNYDNYSATAKLVVRGVTLLDYTPGGPDFRPDLFGLTAHAGFSDLLDVLPGRNIWTVDIGGSDELHGESGDDTAYGAVGHDVIYGDAQDDDLIGGWGNDWISGGTGQDGVIGDDGRIFTSRNTGCSVVSSAVCTQLSEPLYGIYKFRTIDPNTRTSEGDVLNEFIYTPGQVQTATINVLGALAKAVDLTPFNLTPNVLNVGDDPLFDANNSDDIIFGGWDDDFLHGSAGDDAILGGEALATAYIQSYAVVCEQQVECATGLVRTDWTRPYNPGDVLHFGADTNSWHQDHRGRDGEFLLYDEYDPRRTILFNADGTVWKSGTAPANQYFINFDATDGRVTPLGCIQFGSGGTCLASAMRNSDGMDAIFGDLGNDWLVGGTGKDTLWAGWGNDYSNADDDFRTSGYLNDLPDTHPTYEDRAYAGAGIDILVLNTGGDRMIDWVGEFNSYIAPFAPFGIAAVSRQVEPQLPEFLYALSRSQGADPTRTADTTNDATRAVRNGEPDGELGLITQRDHGLWQTQTGGPTDPQPGNIPGGRRDVLRTADFNDGTTTGFATDSGEFSVTGGTLRVAASSTEGDAASVFYLDQYLPIYYEINAQVAMDKPLAGWKANSYVIFDYHSPTDFKFAGIDQSTNKIQLGQRSTSGWIVEAQAPMKIWDNQYYNMLISVNGTYVTVVVDGKKAFAHNYPNRIIEGETYGLNKGKIGVGSDMARGYYDNVSVQVLPPQITLDTTEDFNDGVANLFTGATTGTWTASANRYTGTPAAGATSVATKDVDLGTGLQADSYLELIANAKTATTAGIVFDQYAANDYKFAAIDVVSQQVIIGHTDPRRGWVVEFAAPRSLLANTDYQLQVVLKGASISVLVNGSFIRSWGYNAAVVDGGFGLITRGGASSFDNFHIRTNDRAFAAPAGSLNADTASANKAALPLTESALAPVVADAKQAWIDAGADPSAFDGVRVVVADLAGTQLGQTVAKTIYIDVDAAGNGWGTGGVDLFEVIEHELGHALGYEHSDAAEHRVMGATLHVFAAPSIASGLSEPQRALLAPNGPATAALITQALEPRSRPSLAAPAASLLSTLVAPSAPTSKWSLAPSVLLLRGIVPARASLTGSLGGGRVLGLDTYLVE
jgi:Ca2+-binding RTX toxin-like protein